MQNTLLQTSELLDFKHPTIVQLIKRKNWMGLKENERLKDIYDFVKNDILFGYNEADAIPASQVLKDGIGQCNTKSTLLMALLRACDIPCRLHGFTIDKALQKGAISGPFFWLTPRSIIHTWVEVRHNRRWIALEGCILDVAYLNSVQKQFAQNTDGFCGYGIATPCLADPPVEWQGDDTFIQKDGINQDFGLFDSPDDFYRAHGDNLRGIKRLLFQTWIRHRLNARVEKIRNGDWQGINP